MFIDVSMDIEDGMLHWPKDPPVSLKQFSSIKNGDAANNTLMSLGTHTGTHIDAPHHFIENGISIDAIALDILIGKCRVIEINHNESSITANMLSGLNIKKGERILFKTRNSAFIKSDKRFHEDYVYISNDAAKYLVDAEIILVGVDYLSIEGYGKGHETHRTILGAGIIAIEGLYLGDIPAGEYTLTAMPLKIKGADGAPARVVLAAV